MNDSIRLINFLTTWGMIVALCLLFLGIIAHYVLFITLGVTFFLIAFTMNTVNKI